MAQNMQRIAVAVGQDGETIASGMLGRAAQYLIVDVAPDGRQVARQLRANPYEKTLQVGKTFDVADLLSDCQVLICRRIGGRGITRLKARGFDLILTEEKDAQAALKVWCPVQEGNGS